LICCLGCGLMWTQEHHVLDGAEIPPANKGEILGLFWGLFPHRNAFDCVSTICLQICLQSTAHLDESTASEWTHLQSGWQVQERCGLLSKFFATCLSDTERMQCYNWAIALCPSVIVYHTQINEFGTSPVHPERMCVQCKVLEIVSITLCCRYAVCPLSTLTFIFVQGKNKEAWSQSWMVLSAVDHFYTIYLCW